MTQRSVMHGTFVIERTYPTPVEGVFAAFSNPATKRRWFAEGEELQPIEFEMDFRVGGRERVRFRSKDGSLTFTNHTVYQNIVHPQHIVFVYTMSVAETCISSSQATVEFLPARNGTRLIFTEQGAYFAGSDGPQMRQEGWSKLLDQLANKLMGM